MDIVTYKALNKLWRALGLMAGGALIFGCASNHCYKKQKKHIAELEARIEILESEVSILKLKSERT